ncbi:hypothetical protein LTR28_006488, partial [Elasticomyces elasticus]
MPTVHLLDYAAGNVRSLVNAIEKVGYAVEKIESPEDVAKADALFEGSAEDPAVPGLGIIPGHLERFRDDDKSVPHIGWNSANTFSKDGLGENQSLYGLRPDSKYYYVHAYAVPYREGELEKHGWTVATARYGDEEFVGAVAKDNVLATQFHPEKSGAAGLRVLKSFLNGQRLQQLPSIPSTSSMKEGLTRRIIACLD